MTLHELLDLHYWPDGDAVLRQMIKDEVDIHTASQDTGETPLHVATRRRRLSAVQILLDHNVEIDAVNGDGKSAYAHAVRRSFAEIAEYLSKKGAANTLNKADQLAVAIVSGHYEQAREILEANPDAVQTGNPEEDRLLADVAGRNPIVPVALLINAGANLAAPGLDGGTPLHQAAWFGQPANARLLIGAGAPLDMFDPVHGSSPLHWAVHGSQYSGGAEERQGVYVTLVQMLLNAGSSLNYPGDKSDDYKDRLLKDAASAVRDVLQSHYSSDDSSLST